ncbi:hypothetical protein [Anaerococcus degeneri]|uniref:Uncharacterized protein n=1 Tax=Anaerococcus degeneri TaxID=361500 RepID=A0ABS7YUN1_9FIRM|nr:hypothetical protein [Anaerococcus degeneri]MBP2015177.1 hypothetical protein [Anaerococcus degeneri]MCA2095436.1 hypothetical protein [Anaerococcus degeneri]
MTIEKTRQFYKDFDDICDCAYCRNYIKEIRKSYLELAAYFDKLGVDIEKPFETMPGEIVGGFIEYLGAQYIIIGNKDDFRKVKLGEVTIDLAKSFPEPGIDRDYYVIEIYPIKLKWTIEGEI